MDNIYSYFVFSGLAFLNLTIQNDTEVEDKKYYMKDGEQRWTYENFVDCGVYIYHGNVTEDVVIRDCNSGSIDGYICINGIDDFEAFDIHPEP